MKNRLKKTYLIIALLITVIISGCGSSADKPGVVGENSVPSANTSGDTVSSEETGETENTASEDEVSEEGKYSQVADSSDYTAAEEIDDSIYTPVSASELNDGEYLIDLECSSSMFKVADSLLVVNGDEMNVILRIESDSYLFMYPGTAKEAAADTEDNYITFANNDNGDQLYEIPVPALDKALPYASYSKNKEKWYDRTLLFRSDSLPDEAFKEARYKTASDLKIDDGTYYIDVELEGGSGKASVESPALLLIQDGEAAAMITWSSSNYDYMLIDGVRYDADIVDERSTFVIPVKGFDYRMPVTADTTAMSKPYEIDYTLYFDSATIKTADPEGVAPAYQSMKIKEKIKPEYSTGFTIDSFDNNIYRVTVGKDKYLLVPKLTELPVGIPESVTVIRTPVSKAYVASTSSMDFFTQLSSLDKVGFASAEASKWTDKKVSELVDSDAIHYVGKYDAPDYESLITGKADIAVENTMIYHSPETKEKLEELSVPVFVDMTSYEEDPRGRIEWIKVYGLMTGEYGKALRFFDSACKKAEEAVTVENEKSASAEDKPTVAFFYISPKGHVGIRRPGDYISKMIEMAGGEYRPSNIKVPESDDASSSVDVSMEDFYLKVKDADILIYNSTLYGSPASVDEMVKDTALLDEFKAVKDGKVYVTKDNM
ncbi:MAG: ABC transporter substrate-binding protein, partial [Lachnospiraceae bacterium]|nr:ABC transporter substrate-binding protein [Lachnospiraceae bacterium]